MLRAEDVQDRSIPYGMFMDLFIKGMLGSDWLETEWLLDLYKSLRPRLPIKSLKIHARECSYQAQEDDTSEAGG